ncbi:hypothetical protein PMZ80_003867 [Knufia obscura]|uniref:Uncharacterized protein n=1 Tax=Knufia obscura TaxID=1635080 RepID=A0ABR0RWB8_9EURO|nr:hypothetical protein PMZ80_003867 [Knufia obscura]
MPQPKPAAANITVAIKLIRKGRHDDASNVVNTIIQQADTILLSEYSQARAHFLKLLLTSLQPNIHLDQRKTIATAITNLITAARSKRQDNSTQRKKDVSTMEGYARSVLDGTEWLPMDQAERAEWVKEWAIKVEAGNAKVRDRKRKKCCGQSQRGWEAAIS